MATQTVKVTKRTFTMAHKPKYNRNGTVKPQKKTQNGSQENSKTEKNEQKAQRNTAKAKGYKNKA